MKISEKVVDPWNDDLEVSEWRERMSEQHFGHLLYRNQVDGFTTGSKYRTAVNWAEPGPAKIRDFGCRSYCFQ